MAQIRRKFDWWILLPTGFIALAFALAWVQRWRTRRWGADRYDGPFSSIEYRGHTIKLTRKYKNFKDYKNSAENIDRSQVVLVQKLVAEAPVAHFYRNQEEMIKDEMDWTFPGYGSTAFPGEKQSDGSMLTLGSWEIPEADRDRFLVFRLLKGTYTLLDDFIADDTVNIATVNIEDGRLVYRNAQGKILFRHPIRR